MASEIGLAEAQYVVKRSGVKPPFALERLAQGLYKRGWSWEVQGTPGQLWVAVLAVLPGQGLRAIGYVEVDGYRVAERLVQAYALALQSEWGKG